MGGARNRVTFSRMTTLKYFNEYGELQQAHQFIDWLGKTTLDPHNAFATVRDFSPGQTP
jgi:hypothetical protein